jgi:uncharacterized membrane protein YqjE
MTPDGPIAKKVAPIRRKGTMTLLAVGLLALDGLLLLVAGSWQRSWVTAMAGVALLAIAAAVMVYWRRYQMTMREIEQAKEALRSEVAELRRLSQKRGESQ